MAVGSYHTRRVFSKAEFSFAIEMLDTYPWISRPLHRRGFDEMMDRLILDSSERDFLGELLGRFVYADGDYCEELLDSCINQVKNVWGCTLQDTVFMATRVQPKDNDGSVVFMKHLQDRLYGWKDRNFLNYFQKKHSFASVKEFKKVILVDDFIGSGDTMSERLSLLNDVLSKTRMKHEVYVLTLAGMKVAKSQHPELSADNVFAPLWLDKAFERYVDEEHTHIMDHILSRLSPKNNDGKRYRQAQYAYGFKDTAGLYYNVHYRIPNNVLSFFWWGKFSDGDEYNSMFRRS